MTLPQTLRFRLTMQWVLVISGLLGLFSLAVYLGLRAMLYYNLDATLWAIAENELASAVDNPEGTLHFHEIESEPFLPNGLPRIDKLAQYRTFPLGMLLAKSHHLGDLELPLSATVLGRVTQGEAVFETISFSEPSRVRLLSRPCHTQAEVECIMQVGASLVPVQATLTSLLTLLLVLDGSALLLTACGGAFLAQRALRPVKHLAHAVEHIVSQNLHQRMTVAHPGDEIGRLTIGLNGMLDRLERSFYAQQRFITDASHELRSPLANLRLGLELALNQPRSPEDQLQTCQSALEEVDRLSRLVNGLLTLSRADSGHLDLVQEPVPLRSFLQGVVAEYRVQAEAKHITLTLTLPDVVVSGDDTRLYQLFANLLDNALRHTPPHGQIALHGQLQGDTVRLCVMDTGSGIAPEHLPHIFERFYRVDKERTRDAGGSGLGLAICQEIVHAHGGSIAMQSTVGQGSTCTVILPLCQG